MTSTTTTRRAPQASARVPVRRQHQMTIKSVIAWLLAQGSARELRDVAIAMALGLVLLWWGGRGRVA